MADDLDDEWWKDGQSGDDGTDDEPDEVNDVTEEKPMETVVETEPTAKPSKKKKRKQKKRNITDELKEKGDKPGTTEDFTTFMKKQFEGKLSAIEQDEIQLDSEKHFFAPNTSPGFNAAYLRTLLPKWKKLKSAPQSEGSPLLLIVCPSAMRAVELNRQLQDFKGEGCKCAKLFAKHMKLDDQQKFLKKSICHMGIGTPNRIQALLKSGHLKLDKLRALVLDWNWRDVKQRRLLDVPELKTELAALLKSHLIPNIKSENTCKIGIL